MSQADSRTDGDSWDLASSVGTTATMVAAARAVASREADPLFDDPYAAPLVRAVVYEIDQPQVIEFKSATMASIGVSPATEQRTVGVDLREDWPNALRASGFDVSQPTAWSAEGLLVYLPPEAQDRLFDDITELSAPGSRLATEYHPDAAASIGARLKDMRERWGSDPTQIPDMDITKLFYDGERNGVVEYLGDHGWQVSARRRPDVFAGYGREFPETEALVPLRDSLAVIATRK